MVAYGDKPTLRALLQLIPFGAGSAIDVMLHNRVQQVKVERVRHFFESLDAGEVELSEELIQSEDFLHCFFATTNAALNSRRREKIALFARLLSATHVGEPNLISVDEYEETLRIIDELSVTEWQALLILNRYTNTPREQGDNILIWSKRFWSDFLSAVETELNLPANEITSFLNRLARTGLYEQITGAYLDYAGGIGYLTPRFHRVKKFLIEPEKAAD